jgi:hypothetical protein
VRRGDGGEIGASPLSRERGLGGVPATDAEADGAFVPLPPELWCAALWEEDTALSL